ncbi:MAG: 23S rRNA (guanosine(2251)-2'-O)-methyltransferase RlmB [Clostridia bacterium]|nr:23S rRNA (guanosine(2251)-2'-O)-methyltransferase RlmB [Clostridia bacterium]
MKIEGKNPVREIINSSTDIKRVIIEKGNPNTLLKEIEDICAKKHIKVQYMDKKDLDKMSETGHHQGVIAECPDFEYASLDKLISNCKQEGKDMLFIILDEVLDPHNLGSIIRVAECAGATGVIISNRRSASVNETVVRTSAGATAYLPVVRVTNINQVIEQLKNENVWVYALDMDGEEMYKTNLTGNVALVVGGEGNGVSRLTRKLCDGVISIPMFGQVNSLNASVSAGIATYEVIRQRRK